MGSQQAAAAETGNQNRDRNMVDREAETAESTDEASTVSRDATTVARSHVITLFYDRKAIGAAVKEKLPEGRLKKQAGQTIKLGRGVGVDVLLNDAHIPRLFAELWCSLDATTHETKWYIKNVNEKKLLRIVSANGLKASLKRDEQKEVEDYSELRLETLKFTVKIEEGDIGDMTEFELEFLPSDVDSSSSSSGSMVKQNSTESSTSITSASGLCLQYSGSANETQNLLHVGEPLGGQRHPRFSFDQTYPGGIAMQYQGQQGHCHLLPHSPFAAVPFAGLSQCHHPCSPAVHQPVHQHVHPHQMHHSDHQCQTCTAFHHPQNLHGNSQCTQVLSECVHTNPRTMYIPSAAVGAVPGQAMHPYYAPSTEVALGLYQASGFSVPITRSEPLNACPGTQEATINRSPFPGSEGPQQSLTRGIIGPERPAEYPSSSYGGTLYASLAQPPGNARFPAPFQQFQDMPSQFLPQPLLGPQSMQALQHERATAAQGGAQLLTRHRQPYVAQPESAAMLNFQSFQSQGQLPQQLPRSIITTPTTQDSNPRLHYYPNSLPAAPPTELLDSMRLHAPIQVVSEPAEATMSSFHNSTVPLMPDFALSRSTTQQNNFPAGAGVTGLQSDQRAGGSWGSQPSVEAPTLTDHSSHTAAAGHTDPRVTHLSTSSGQQNVAAPSAAIAPLSSLNQPAMNGNRINLRIHRGIWAPPNGFGNSESLSSVVELDRVPPRQRLSRQPAEDDERQPQEHEEDEE